MRKKKKTVRQNGASFAIIICVILTIYTISKMSMYVWGFYTSLKSQFELMHSTIAPPQGWPWDWAWENYTDTFANIKIPKGFETLFAYHKQLLKVVASKCDIGLRIKKAFDADDRKTLAALVSELTVLSVEIQKLYDERAKLWYENNKPFGFEQVGSRIMAVRGLVINAYTRISSYLAGDVETLPELCEERLYYNSEEMPFVGDYVADNIMIP